MIAYRKIHRYKNRKGILHRQKKMYLPVLNPMIWAKEAVALMKELEKRPKLSDFLPKDF